MRAFPGRQAHVARTGRQAHVPGRQSHLGPRGGDLQLGLEPHRPAVLLLAGTDAPDFHVDIEPVLRTKVRAVLAHTSQMGGRSEAELMRVWRERAREQRRTAAAAGADVPADDSDPLFRESFRRVVLRH